MGSTRKTRRSRAAQGSALAGSPSTFQSAEAPVLTSHPSRPRPLPHEVAATRDGLSFEARRRGFTSALAVKAEFLRQQQDWWLGTHFYCPFCDEHFDRPVRAAEHLTAWQHPVLRWDDEGE